MKQHQSRRAPARSLLYVSMTLGAAALASSAMSDGLKSPDAESMRLLGHNDMQNRPIYQPTVHKYPSQTAQMGGTPANAYAGKTIFFAGLHAATGGGGCTGSLPNPLNGGAVISEFVQLLRRCEPVELRDLAQRTGEQRKQASHRLIVSGRRGSLQADHV